MIELFPMIIPIIRSIVFAVVVFVVGMLIIGWINKVVSKFVEKKGLDATLKPFVKTLIRVLLKIILAISIISILGIDTASFVAIFAAAGFAIGLAFQGSLSNFAGGVLLIAIRPFKVGDFIEVSGYIGNVEAIQILYTNIVTLDNKVIRIPNGSLSDACITNYSEKDTRRVDFQFSASYEADFEKVIRSLSDVVDKHPLALKAPTPFVRLSEHGESAMIYTVRVWVKAKDYWTVYFDIIETVKKRFDEENLSIPYHQMDIHIHNKVVT
ncbi:mechanosensitive ion channel family protein [Anaerotignum sp.]|uniref:mechanosensitive ion channel family protein n=1 Tax=Anaerotignum sp. TaxID=2039241 RepID=UPI0027149005|nr:mechanosensitive ion channel domain-containing protein [Anaerotignum sp.]